MIIGIDANEANTGRRVGIGEYAYELLTQFSKLHIAESKWQIYLKDDPGSDLPEETHDWKYRVLKPGKLWTQWRLPLDLYWHRPRPDIFFTMSHYAPRISPVPTIVSVMDLAYVHFPEYFAEKDLYQLKNWTKYSVENAKAVITISNSSKNDIINTYSISPDNVHVVHLGIKDIPSLSPHVYSMNELIQKFSITKKYILSVGTLQPRKNTARLIEAFAKLRNSDAYKDSDLMLVIVGKKGWLYEDIIAAPEKFGVSEAVKFLDFVTDEELAELYKNAQVYVFPSLYEGFGLPVLEAMKFGCPVITSNVSSLPEAGGDAALYVDPKDVDDIAGKIKKVLEDKHLHAEMVKKGHEQIKKFSWEKSAKQTLSIINEVARAK